MNTNIYPCQTAVGRELLGILVHLSMVHYFLCLMREKSDSDWRESVTQRVTLLFLSFLCFFFFIWKSSSVICIRSSSQLKVTRCLQIKSRSFDRTGWPKSLRSEEKKKRTQMIRDCYSCVCVCVWITHTCLCIREMLVLRPLQRSLGQCHVWVFVSVWGSCSEGRVLYFYFIY